MLKDKLQADLKNALLAHDKERVEVLRMLKGAILNAEIQSGSRDAGLDDAAILVVLAKESKKRSDAAEMYNTAGASVQANKELFEKDIIDGYLPARATEAEVRAAIAEVGAALGGITQQTMGQVIGAVNKKLAGTADGSMVARLVKELI